MSARLSYTITGGNRGSFVVLPKAASMDRQPGEPGLARLRDEEMVRKPPPGPVRRDDFGLVREAPAGRQRGRVSVNIGGTWSDILLRVEGESAGYFHGDRQPHKRAERERLRVDIVIMTTGRRPNTLGGRQGPLEQQVTEIIQGLFLQVEDDSRKWAVMHHKWRCEDHARS